MHSPSEILNQYWGHAGFRPLQEDIIRSVMDGRDTLALLPTGGGKSVCFQVPALAMEGVCIVVTPLIALMKDQVDALNRKNIKAASIYSGMSKREIDVTLDNCIYGQVKFLYVSPERLQTELFVARAQQMKVNLLAVDEAHCISQWGYDFRPSYLEIATFKQLLPDTPCIALTATATPRVKEDIIQKLDLKTPNTFQGSFLRTKLSLSVRKTADKESKLLEILEKVPGSAIVYVNSRKAAKQLSLWLNHNDISADFYHAGLSHDSRRRKQEEWQMNLQRVMVSTNAFGMGIDKPDVRLVIHYDMPTSIEAYYQEAGRAGRDQKIAYGVILYQESDLLNQQALLEKSHPSPEYIRKVYQAMANYLKIAVGSSALESYDFDVNEFSANFNFSSAEVYQAIQKLKEEGFVDLNESFYHPSRFIFNAGKERVYDFQVANEEYDLLIKAMLRLYGGESFRQFTDLSERQLAKYLNASTYQVIKKLEALQKNGIITYDKIKDTPQLTFLTQRYDAAVLPLNLQRLKERKAVAKEKLQRLAGYVATQGECRMKTLCRYFGEELAENCGKCDVCLGRKGEEMPARDVARFSSLVKESLRESPKTEKELAQDIKNLKSEQVVVGIKALLQTGEIYYDRGGRLHLSGK